MITEAQMLSLSNGQPENRMPPVANSRQRHKQYDSKQGNRAGTK